MDQQKLQQQQQQQGQAYVDSVMKTFSENPEKLSAAERQLAEKCATGSNRIASLTQAADTMRRQIEQAQNRLKQIEMGMEGEQGRINGFVELLVEAKFGGNGAEKSSPEPEEPVNRKQRRAEQAKAKAAAKTKAKAKEPSGDPPRATA